LLGESQGPGLKALLICSGFRGLKPPAPSGLLPQSEPIYEDVLEPGVAGLAVSRLMREPPFKPRSVL